MPVYRYRNLTTNETFDFEQRITEPALSTHPETGDPVKRLIQPVGIAFKGSGFYVNDSRSGSKANGKSDKSEKTDKEGVAKTDASSPAASKPDKPNPSASTNKTESKAS